MGLNLGIYLNFVVIFRVAMLCCRKACVMARLVILSVSEKSTEFKIRLKFKAKNPYCDFMDTSLTLSMTKFKICGLPRKFLKNLQILFLKGFEI